MHICFTITKLSTINNKIEIEFHFICLKLYVINCGLDNKIKIIKLLRSILMKGFSGYIIVYRIRIFYLEYNPSIRVNDDQNLMKSLIKNIESNFN